MQAMLDLEEVGVVTLDELVFAAKEYSAAHFDAGDPSNGELSELLSKLMTRMRVTPASVQSVFQRLDLQRAGCAPVSSSTSHSINSKYKRWSCKNQTV